MPFFSIVIPTYNRAGLIGKTIESVLNQKFRDFELLIVDDGSTDNTEQIVLPFFGDSRVSYYKKQNAERGAARNFGTAKAVGQYINFFDSDDLMYPSHLEVAKDFIEKKSQPEVFHLAYDYKTPEGKLIYCRNSFDEKSTTILLFDNILSCNGVVVRMDVAKANLFEESRVMASAEDWALWLKLASKYKLHYCNKVTSAIIAHDTRSIYTINIDKVINRDLFLIEHLRTDLEVMNFYKGNFSKFIAQRYTFIMLAFSEKRIRLKTLEWALKAIKAHPGIIVSRRFLASIRNIFTP